MKVIFLDLDGVLCSGNYLWTTHSLRHLESKTYGIPYRASSRLLTKTRDKFNNLFDPTCVMNFKKIIMMTDAKIVISSSWRRGGLEELQKMWKFRKMPGELIDHTPQWASNGSFKRGDEIKEWLDNHPEVERYCIIDDQTDMLDEQLPYFVNTIFEYGIDFYKANEAIHILNQQ